MAYQIKETLTMVYENGNLKNTFQPGTMSLAQATKGIHIQTVAATTAEADVSVGTIGTPGICVMYNLEGSTTGKTWNWGPKSSTGGLVDKYSLPPMQMALVHYASSTGVIRGKAASGTLSVQVITYEA